MSENKVPPLPAGILTEEQIQAVAGGSCTAEQIVILTNQLKTAYDNLIDFTSYVIERVVAK